MSKASAILAVVWFFCFLVSVGSLYLLVLRNAVELSQFKTAFEQVSKLYAPYVGAVLAFYLTKKFRPRRENVSTGAFITAITASIVWNLAVCGVVLLVLIDVIKIEPALEIADGAGANLSWLVAPAIGYFFASPGEKTK